MNRPVLTVLLGTTILLLGGCGAAETAAVAAAQAEQSVEEAKRAQKTLDKVEEDLAAAQQATSDARAALDEAN